MYVFLEQLAARLGMRVRGGDLDMTRAAKWFVEWWRRQGSLISASAPRSLLVRRPSLDADAAGFESGSGRMCTHRGWGFDFEWTVEVGEQSGSDGKVEEKMGACIDAYMQMAAVQEEAGGDMSQTQERKRAWEDKLARRAARGKGRVAHRSG